MKIKSLKKKTLKYSFKAAHDTAYLKHKGVIELWLAAFAPGLGLTMVSIFRWQKL